MKRILRILLPLILACAFIALIARYTPQAIEKPSDTNLELWITEKADADTFSGYERAWMHTRFANRSFSKPGIAVTYEVGPYPDYSGNSEYIVGIEIRDPSVVVYGLSVDASAEEFTKTMSAKGFSISDNIEKYRKKYELALGFDESNITVARKGRELVVFYPEQHAMSFFALVTNGFKNK